MPRNKTPTLNELLKEASDAAAEVERKQQEKTAAAAAANMTKVASLDLMSTETIGVLAKSARLFAQHLRKRAQEGQEITDKGLSLTESTPSPEQAKDPEAPALDIDPPKSEFSIPQETSETAGAPSLTPSTPQPEQEFPDKTSAAVRHVHDVYARAIRKMSEQPMGAVDKNTTPMAGPTPEDAPDRAGAKPDDSVGGDEQAVDLTRQDAITKLRPDEAEILSAGAVSAAKSDPVLPEALDVGKQAARSALSPQMKAAALRAIIAQRVRAGDPTAHELLERVRFEEKRAQTPPEDVGRVPVDGEAMPAMPINVPAFGGGPAVAPPPPPFGEGTVVAPPPPPPPLEGGPTDEQIQALVAGMMGTGGVGGLAGVTPPTPPASTKEQTP